MSRSLRAIVREPGPVRWYWNPVTERVQALCDRHADEFPANYLTRVDTLPARLRGAAGGDVLLGRPPDGCHACRWFG